MKRADITIGEVYAHGGPQHIRGYALAVHRDSWYFERGFQNRDDRAATRATSKYSRVSEAMFAEVSASHLYFSLRNEGDRRDVLSRMLREWWARDDVQAWLATWADEQTIPPIPHSVIHQPTPYTDEPVRISLVMLPLINVRRTLDVQQQLEAAEQAARAAKQTAKDVENARRQLLVHQISDALSDRGIRPERVTFHESGRAAVPLSVLAELLNITIDTEQDTAS